MERKASEKKCVKMCNGCLEKFRKITLPSPCILNGFTFGEQPKEIYNLDSYEKHSIQRAKAFQVVTKMV